MDRQLPREVQGIVDTMPPEDRQLFIKLLNTDQRQAAQMLQEYIAKSGGAGLPGAPGAGTTPAAPVEAAGQGHGSSLQQAGQQMATVYNSLPPALKEKLAQLPPDQMITFLSQPVEKVQQVVQQAQGDI